MTPLSDQVYETGDSMMPAKVLGMLLSSIRHIAKDADNMDIRGVRLDLKILRETLKDHGLEADF